MRIVAIILLGGVLACVLVHLTADPPINLSGFRSDYIDEGLYSHSARNKALFGTWEADEFEPILVTPTFTLAQYAVFSTLGVSYATLRLTAVLACAITVAAACLVVSRLYGIGWGCASIVLFGCNFYFVIFSRQAVLEGPVLALMTLSLLFLLLGRENGFCYALAGASAMIAVSTKYLHPYSLVALTAATAFVPLLNKGSRRFRPLWLFLAGLGVIVLAIAVVFVVPNWDRVTAYFVNYGPKRLPGGGSRLAANILSQPFWNHFRDRAHLILALLPLCFFYLGYDLVRRRRADVVELACLLWLLAGLATFAMLNFRPPRYYLPVFAPMVILAVAGLARFWGREHYPLAVDLAGVFCLLGIVDRVDAAPAARTFMLGGGTVMALARLVPWFMARPRLSQRLSLALLLVPLAIGEGAKYYEWVVHPRYSLIDTSADLARQIPLEGAYIVGKGFNVPLCTNNRHRPILRAEMWNHYALEQYERGYLLDSRENRPYYKRHFGSIVRHMKWIKNYTVMGIDMSLYALPPPVSPEELQAEKERNRRKSS